MKWPNLQSSQSTHARRHPPRTFERLEDRALLSGDLLLTAQVPGQIVYHLLRYTQSGSQLNNVLIPHPPGSTEYQDARGLTVDPTGNVNIYDGTFTPYLDTLKPANGTWSYQTYPGWSTVNNISYGEVAAYKNYVFASDMVTYTGGEPNGIVRFDTSGGPTVRFAQGTDFIQVALGLDGLIYGLGGSGDVHVFHPDSLAPVRTFSLSGGPDSDIRSIAVDVTGQVLGATWGGYVAKYDPSGNYLASTQLKGQYGFGESLINIALDTDGQVAVGGRSGEIYLTDESLASVTTIQTNQWNVFVTFDHYIGTVPMNVTPSFNSLAEPTITYGTATTTLSGHIVAGTQIPTGNVAITLNGVTQGAAIDPASGQFSSDFTTSGLGASSSPYAITYSYAGDDNSTAVSATTSLTVSPAPLTVTADAEIKTYSAADPALTYRITSGNLVNGDSFSGTLSRDAGEDVGTYAIRQGTLTAGGNYSLSYVGANLTIATRPITVTADAETKTYGAADPALTYRITSGNLVNGDTFSGTLTRAPGENVGSYAIQQGTLALGSNYDLTYVGANLTITKANTTTVVASSANSSAFGQSVTFTATVSVVSPGAGSPTGTVTFYDGSTPIGTGKLNGSKQATFTTNSLAVGSHTITAVYGGDGNFNASPTSAAITQTVKNADMTILTSSVNPSKYGQNVIFTATVSPVNPMDGTPTGTVTFMDGTTVLTTVPLDRKGTATFAAKSLTRGSHLITAVYSGDSNFAENSGYLTQAVK